MAAALPEPRDPDDLHRDLGRLLRRLELATGATAREPAEVEARASCSCSRCVGLLPTLVAVVGWLLLLAASLRSPPRLALALLPLLGIAGYLYFTVSYPTPDGDVLKGTYMLTTVVGWAFGFGYALDRLRGNWFTLVATLLVLCALVELPFLFY